MKKFWFNQKQLLLSTFIFFIMFNSIFTQDKEPTPPDAKKIPVRDTMFNVVRVDYYDWLENRDNPEVIEYLKAENAYTEMVMKHTEDFQNTLYEEMKSRIKETDLSVPVKIDNYFYYNRTEEGKQYSIYCRKKGSMDAKEEILLDQNVRAEGHDYYHIGVFKISPDHNLVAFSEDTTGGEAYTLYIKNLKTGEFLPEKIENTYYSMEWGNKNNNIFYTVLDDTKRPYKLYRHQLNTSPENDVLVHQEDDQAFYLSIYKTKSKKYLLMQLGSMVTSEVHFLDADNPTGKFRVMHPRQHQMEYFVEHHDDKFYIVTNDEAKNFKIVTAPVKDPSKENWIEYIPHRKDVKIDGLDTFKDHLVIYQRENGLKTIRIINFSNREDYRIDFPEPSYTYWSGENPDFNSEKLRFTYTSLVTPKAVYDYNMNDRTRELKKQDEVLGGYNPDNYETERIFAETRDGTKIPISLVYKKGLKKDGNNPLLLYGYGSYGANMDPYFRSTRVSLLDRGFIYAIAHIRGGGEMGRYWYEDGKFLKKKNTFYDFIDCAEYLVENKYTNKDKLVIRGGSAGGLLMGAVTNMRPDLFSVVLAHVPFVDVLNTMLNENLPLTVIEYEEWGNPNNEKYFHYIKSYSPYDNVEAEVYPDMLITAGLNDPRVSYWEPAKWTAKLRDFKLGDNLLLLKTKMGAGHGGASGRYDYLKDLAFEYAFVFDRLGIKE